MKKNATITLFLLLMFSLLSAQNEEEERSLRREVRLAWRKANMSHFTQLNLFKIDPVAPVWSGQVPLFFEHRFHPFWSVEWMLGTTHRYVFYHEQLNKYYNRSNVVVDSKSYIGAMAGIAFRYYFSKQENFFLGFESRYRLHRNLFQRCSVGLNGLWHKQIQHIWDNRLMGGLHIEGDYFFNNGWLAEHFFLEIVVGLGLRYMRLDDKQSIISCPPIRVTIINYPYAQNLFQPAPHITVRVGVGF